MFGVGILLKSTLCSSLEQMESSKIRIKKNLIGMVVVQPMNEPIQMWREMGE